MYLLVFLLATLLSWIHYAAAQDGYATEKGGVTGGSGGTTTTVSSAAAFETAIAVSLRRAFFVWKIVLTVFIITSKTNLPSYTSRPRSNSTTVSRSPATPVSSG